MVFEFIRIQILFLAFLVDTSSIEDYTAKVKKLVGLKAETGKPFCTLCGRECSNKAMVVDHIKALHLNRADYQCQFCPSKFKTAAHKNKHVSRKHRQENKLSKVFGAEIP